MKSLKGRLIFALGTLVVIALCPWLGPEFSADQREFVLWQLRVPRVLMAALVGMVLGTCGAAYQTIFSNPLATPSTVGTTAGAALGALVAVLMGGTTAWALPIVALCAFAGALVVTLFIAAIAASGRARSNDILLAGIAITLAAGAISTGLQFQADMASTFEAIRWSLGNLSQIGFRGVLMILPFALIATVTILFNARALESMMLGEAKAKSQGVDVVRVRSIVLGVGALGVGACVAWCGPISFVGLIVPHVMRIFFGSTRRILLPMSAVFGAGFLVVCDTVARTLLEGRDLPVGVMTAGIGAPFLVWLVIHPNRRSL